MSAGPPAIPIFTAISVTLSSSAQRIDPPRVGPSGPVAKAHGQRGSAATAGKFQRFDVAHQEPEKRDPIAGDATDPATARENWLQLQATDLIARLQKWSAELDAREAQLNAAMAQHDLRERLFRVRQQEFDADLRRQQEEIDALREQLSAQARRLAFQIT